MYAANFLPILLLVLSIGTNHQSEAFRCYECRSRADGPCDAGKDQKAKLLSYLTDCKDKVVPKEDEGSNTTTSESDVTSPSTTNDGKIADEKPSDGAWHCRKVVQTLYVKSPSVTTVIRECARKIDGQQCVKMSNKVVSMQICECSQESCNGSPMSSHLGKATTFRIFFSALIALFIRN